MFLGSSIAVMLVTLVFAGLGCLFFFLMFHANYSGKRLLKQIPEVPFSMPSADGGTDPAANMHWHSLKRHRKLGGIFREVVAKDVSMVYVADPAMARRVLGTSSREVFPQINMSPHFSEANKRLGFKRGLVYAKGEEWHQMRSVVNKIFFKRDIVEESLELGRPATDALLAHFETHAADGGAIPGLLRKLRVWAVESTLRHFIGSNYDTVAALSSWNPESYVDASVSVGRTHLKLTFTPPAEQAERDSEDWREFAAAVGSALGMTANIVRQALRDEQPHDGMLAYMAWSGKLDEDQLVGVMGDVISGATNTLSPTAAWCLHMAAKGGDQVQRRIAKDEQYTTCFVKEVMRLYPSATFIARILQEDVCPDPDAYLPLSAGTKIMVSNFAMGRDEKFFPDADKFIPERWMEDGDGELRGVTPFASLPFGFGARACPGRVLGLRQLNELLRCILSRYQLESLNENPVELTMELTGIPDQEIRIRPRER